MRDPSKLDVWLLSRRADQIFLVSAILVMLATPSLWRLVDTTIVAFKGVALLGLVAGFAIWLGMWRYWLRIDSSRPWPKRIWFIVLLIGYWYGSILYYFLVYARQVNRLHTDGTMTELDRHVLLIWFVVGGAILVLIRFPYLRSIPAIVDIFYYLVLVLVPASFVYVVHRFYRRGIESAKHK